MEKAKSKMRRQTEYKKALAIATQTERDLKDVPFNDSIKDSGWDLYTFELDGAKLNVFAYISKQRNEDTKAEWYSIYSGVEYVGGDNIFADYAHSTSKLSLAELTDRIFDLTMMYRPDQKKNLEHLRKLMHE